MSLVLSSDKTCETILHFDSRGHIRDSNNDLIGTIQMPASCFDNVKQINRKEENNQNVGSSILIDYFLTRSPEQLKRQVSYLKSITQPEQRSKEWYEMRKSRLTASDLAGAIGESTYDKPVDILEKKLGAGPPFTGNAATRWGQQYEDVACAIYSAREKVTVEEFGLLPHPTIPFLGASPDGIAIETSRMLEIKCPPKRVITGIVPRGYEIQMQLQLEVCDLEECDFLECKFEEYFNLSQFKYDSRPEDMMRTRDGLEKGCMLELYDRQEGKNCYRYCPVDLGFEATQKWSADQQRQLQKDASSRYVFRKEIWWKVITYSCVLVKRDRMWFNSILPKIRAFWREVCYYRTQPLDVFYRDHGKKPKADVVIEDDSDEDPDGAEESRRIAFLTDTDSDTELPQRNSTKRKNDHGKQQSSKVTARTGPTNVAYLSDSD